MAIFARNTKQGASLVTTLATKGTDRRTAQEADAESARQFIIASGEAQASSDKARRDAEAIEKAVKILDEAGVEI